MSRAEEQRILEAYRAHLDAGEALPDALVKEIDALFAACQGRVYAACRRIVFDEEQARDLAQEALLTGYRKLHTFRGESQFGTWLFGIARMLCMNAIRRRRELLTEDGVLEPDDPVATAIAQMRRQEREVLLREATKTLPPLEQEALYLRYVEGISRDRITEILNLKKASGARGLLQKSRRLLQVELRARAGALGHGSSLFRDSLS